MESCYTTFEGPNGEKKTTAADGSQQCKYQTDIYGNFSPTRFHYDVLANFETQTWNAPSTYGIFYKFGITDVRLKLLHISEFTGTWCLGVEIVLSWTEKDKPTPIFSRT